MTTPAGSSEQIADALTRTYFTVLPIHEVTTDGHGHVPSSSVREIGAELGMRYVHTDPAGINGRFVEDPRAADADRYVRLRTALRVLRRAGVPAGDVDALREALGLEADHPAVAALAAQIDESNDRVRQARTTDGGTA